MAKKKTTDNLVKPLSSVLYPDFPFKDYHRPLMKPIHHKTRTFDTDFTREVLFELRELLDQARERNAIMSQRTLKHSIIIVEDYLKKISS